MAYSRDYFELQLNFAKRVSRVTGKRLLDVLLHYTSFYKTFRIEGWDFDSSNPIWKEFIGEFQNSNDDVSTTYDFYLKKIKLKEEKNKKKLLGCFSYEYNKSKRAVSVHFRNVDTPEPGALSYERVGQRKKELKEMFLDIKNKCPEVKKVCGFSWLYNIEAYKRLFPPEYTQNYKVVTDWFRSTALWGQFLDSSEKLKPDFAENFNVCISKKRTVDELKDCFLLKPLKPLADIKYFYEFYGVDET